MNIGIVVHSLTGNTLSVAERLQKAFLACGHSAALERVTAVDEKASSEKELRLKDIPDISGYDALVFAAPVHGFSLSPVMALYLSGLSSLNGKRTGLFVTQFFPRAWMGGNRAVRQMVRLCEAKKAVVSHTSVVNWSSRQRERLIECLTDNFKDL